MPVHQPVTAMHPLHVYTCLYSYIQESTHAITRNGLICAYKCLYTMNTFTERVVILLFGVTPLGERSVSARMRQFLYGWVDEGCQLLVFPFKLAFDLICKHSLAVAVNSGTYGLLGIVILVSKLPHQQSPYSVYGLAATFFSITFIHFLVFSYFINANLRIIFRLTKYYSKKNSNKSVINC